MQVFVWPVAPFPLLPGLLNCVTVITSRSGVLCCYCCHFRVPLFLSLLFSSAILVCGTNRRCEVAGLYAHRCVVINEADTFVTWNRVWAKIIESVYLSLVVNDPRFHPTFHIVSSSRVGIFPGWLPCPLPLSFPQHPHPYPTLVPLIG